MNTLPIKETDKANAGDQKTLFLIASGDLRLSANQTCWVAQEDMEKRLIEAFQKEGVRVVRAHPYDSIKKHGFIDSQRMGMDVFENIPPDSPIVVAEAVWQYSHHVLAGLRSHQGPILTIANWSGEWPGLVGLLNLNGSLTKMGVKYSTLWSENFRDNFFINGIQQWLNKGEIQHDTSHVSGLVLESLPEKAVKLGKELAKELKKHKAILGIFDEGCMGMYNAIIDDEILNQTGVYKERLSQSALVAEMRIISDAEACSSLDWLESRGMKFYFGTDEATELTRNQVLQQLKMYSAATRIANNFGCDAIGIQYQQGLKDMSPASDLAEGLLNNVERPPVCHPETNQELYPGQPVIHFNEVDEGAGLDALVTNRIWTKLGFDPATTLHDLRYGEHYTGGGIDEFVWVFLISGAAPPSHFTGGYSGAFSQRQPPMYFPLGGGTLQGVSKPGEIVWSRIFVMDGQLHADLGLGTVVELPDQEVQRRWKATTPVWPIMNAIIKGVSRDQMMARHKANHLNVAYAPSVNEAWFALAAKAAMLDEMGIKVHLCGVKTLPSSTLD
jgi:hypothetical protein